MLLCIQHELKPKHAVMGSALHIPLPSGLKSGSSVSVKVTYKTTKDCTALQWLEKEYVRDEMAVGHDLTREYSDKRRGRHSRTCSVSVSLSMPEPWRHYKVFLLCIVIWYIPPAHFLADTPSVKIVRVLADYRSPISLILQ